MDKQTEFVEKLSAQVVEWEAEIASLEQRAETAPEDAKSSYRKSIEELQRKRKDAQATLQRTGTTDVDTVEDLERGSEGIIDDVKHDLRKAVLKVK